MQRVLHWLGYRLKGAIYEFRYRLGTPTEASGAVLVCPLFRRLRDQIVENGYFRQLISRHCERIMDLYAGANR